MEASGHRCSEWRYCVVVRRLTPLLRGIGCDVSWTTASAETWRVHRERGAGGGACNASSPCWCESSWRVKRGIIIIIIIIIIVRLSSRHTNSKTSFGLFWHCNAGKQGYDWLKTELILGDHFNKMFSSYDWTLTYDFHLDLLYVMKRWSSFTSTLNVWVKSHFIPTDTHIGLIAVPGPAV